MKKKWRYIGKIIKGNFFQLLGFEFVYKISAFILFFPLILRVMDSVTDHAGILYITSKNISKFLKSPFLVASTAVSLIVFICISFYEVCCIWACCRNYSDGKRVHISDMFIDGFSLVKSVCRKHRAKIWLQMTAIFPLINFHMIIVLFHKIDILENCIKYFFKGVPEIFIGVIASVISVLAAAFVLRSFGSTVSGRRNKKDFFRSAGYLVILNVSLGLMLILLFLLLVFFAAVILRFTGDKQTAFSQLIKFENNIYYFLVFIAGAFGVIMNTVLTFVIITNKTDRNAVAVPVKDKRKKIKRLCVSVLIFIITAADMNSLAEYMINGSQLLEDILISTTVTAHRGGAKFVPENTMYGVDYAIESGADYIEIDVQMSSDGVVFLLHDTSLRRTTGSNRNAYALTYEDISKLDAGSYFNEKFSDAHIPTLDEVLTACKSKINLNIEIKRSGNAGNTLPDKVLELINAHDMQQQCVITSTDYSYLKYIKQKQPGIRTGYIANMLYGDAASLEYADFFSVKHVVVNEGFVRAAHNAGKEVHVWTVNTKYLINRMKGLDVDSIITDNPVLCRKILSRKNDKKSFAEILQTLLYR